MSDHVALALEQAQIPSAALVAVLDVLALSTEGFAQLAIDVDWPFAALTVVAPAVPENRRVLAERLQARGMPAAAIAGAFDRAARVWLVELGSARHPGEVPITLHARGEGDALTELTRLGRLPDVQLEGAAASLLGGRVDAIAVDDVGTLVLERDTDAPDAAYAALAIARLVDAPVDSAAFHAAHARLAGAAFALSVTATRDGLSGVRARYAPATWPQLFEGLGLFRGARWASEAASIAERIGAAASVLGASRPAGLELSLARTGLGVRVILNAATAVGVRG